MKKPPFNGVATALITPFKNGKIDYDRLKHLIDFQIDSGINALVIMGTTGESSTVTPYEYQKIASLSGEYINGRVPYILGAGSNCTKTAVKKSLIAKKVGANAILVVTPYYNKCSEEGLLIHYNEISKASNLPIIAYNVPSRTGVNVLPKTAGKLCDISCICGIKEASNLKQIYQTLKTINNKISLYSGDDNFNLDVYKLGGSGAISVSANLFPKEVCFVYEEFKKKNFLLAEKMQELLTPLNKALFLEVNPIPVKAGAKILGLCSQELRLPLTDLSKQNYNLLKEVINDFKGGLC